jgi:hypothetical protein
MIEQTVNCTILARRSEAPRCLVKLQNMSLEVLEGRQVSRNEVEMVK